MDQLNDNSQDDIKTEEDKQTVQGINNLMREAQELEGLQITQIGGASEEEETEPTMETSALLMGAFSPLFDIFAPNWDVKAEEKQALCEAYGAVIDKYYPDGVGGKFATELTALTITGMIIAPRIGTPRKKSEKEVNAAPKKTSSKSEPAQDVPESGSELGQV
jgi:hypothetical protein